MMLQWDICIIGKLADASTVSHCYRVLECVGFLRSFIVEYRPRSTNSSWYLCELFMIIMYICSIAVFTSLFELQYFNVMTHFLDTVILQGHLDDKSQGHFNDLVHHLDTLMQDCGISSAYVLEIPQSCTRSSIFVCVISIVKGTRKIFHHEVGIGFIPSGSVGCCPLDFMM